MTGLNLKPCPFCGGVANNTIRFHSHEDDQRFDEVMIYCIQCGATQSDIDHEGADHVERAREVIKRWNRRAKPQGFKP
jgi:Lar family restriction alleviation protein